MERKKIHRFKSRVLDNKNLNHSVKHLTISIPQDFDFYSGQFVSLIMDKDGTSIRRPYSIASKPGLPYLELCIKILSNGLITPIIGKLKKDDEIEVLGPMGEFTIRDKTKNIVLISTGTGIGPFRSIIYYLLENNFANNLILLTGYRFEEDALYEQELRELENKYKKFSYSKILSKTNSNEDAEKLKNLKNSTNSDGYVQNLVKKNIDSSGDTYYYICGLKEMVNSVKELLLQNGIPKENIFFERYD